MTAERTESRTRQDIQGLRAIAVALVLVYHLLPAALPGGYVGVDVFFVISGFLITGQLLREAELRGRIDLPRFWARRARRLLPAALLVLAVTLLAVRAIAPTGLRPAFLVQLAASAGYAQNWVLAAQSVDYLAAEAEASPVQHYWSLSVEEQFYLVWPLVAFAAILIARRAFRGSKPNRRALAALVAAIAIVSLAVSIVLTAASPAVAYFSTATRAWEFAAGGLLACCSPAIATAIGAGSHRIRIAAVWIGLACIALAATAFSDATPFPGVAALLPVSGAVLVIAAAEPRGTGSPQVLLASRPAQWLGDVSYGAYLWHFPLIVLLPYALGSGYGVAGRLAVIAATLLLAQASKTLIEDPFRTGAARGWSSRRMLSIAAGSVAALVVAALGAAGAADDDLVAERARVADEISRPSSCLGATALDADSGCEPLPEVAPIPDPALAGKAEERCLVDFGDSSVRTCEYGAKPSEAGLTVALVGDSHAEQWLAPLKLIAEREHWRLLVMAKASCPFTAAERDYVTMEDGQASERSAECAEWNRGALRELREQPDLDVVITGAKAADRVLAESGEDWRSAATAGYEQRWAELPSSVRTVIAMKDTPQLERDLMRCVTEKGTASATECATPASEALGADPLADAAELSDTARLVDLSAYFVVDGECPPVIGGVLVYRDSHHLNWAYATMLESPLEKALQVALDA